MKCKAETLAIVLNENEIDDFWNIIMFAKDLHNERTNKKEKYGSCLIIIEEPLSGKVYQFGNYDRKVVYEHGSTKGYA